MSIRHFTAEQIIDPETGANYKINNTNTNFKYLHTHEYFELHLVTSGILRHSFADGTSHLLPTGTFLFIRPPDAHVCLPSTEEACEYINIAYSIDTVEELFRFLGDGFRPERLMAPQYPPAFRFTEVEGLKIRRSFDNICAIPRQQKELIRTLLRSLLALCLLKAFPAQLYQEESEVPEWLLSLYEEMKHREHFVVGVERMVELSGRSHHHLCRVFKRYFQLTPTDYVNVLRLNRAAHELACSVKSVTDIALDLGFGNLSHFHHLFKKQFGASPGQFRVAQRI